MGLTSPTPVAPLGLCPGTVALWSLGQFLLIWMATIDPQMLSVFRRLRQYPGFVAHHAVPQAC
jgi:type IV secretory pathway TrbD component